MTIKKLKDFSKTESFLAKCFSSPTHWPDWNTVVAKHYGLDFYYLATYENNAITGLCPVFENKRKQVSVLNSGQVKYIPYGGWIFSNPVKIDPSQTKIRFNQTFSGFTLPVIEEFNAVYPENPNPAFLSLLVDLTMPYEQIFAEQFEHRVRKAIRKSENNNVTLFVDQDYQRFFRHYEESCQIRKLHTQSLDFFRDLFEGARNITFDILWARQEEKYLGYLVIVYDKNFSIGFQSYMFPDTPKVGQGDFLIAEAVKLSQQKGCKYFDLCFIEKERLPSIYEFKKGFSHFEVPILHFSKKPLSYRVINKLFR